MKKQLSLLLCLALTLCLLAGCQGKNFTSSTNAPKNTTATPAALNPENTSAVDLSTFPEEIDSMSVEDFTETTEMTEYVKLSVEGYGELVLRLRPDAAPITAANFQDLVSRHFYDGLTFHRVYPRFMIQGGDPKGNGTGDSGTTIQGEFAANGFQNELAHLRGVVSMARGGDLNSASCQFFIVHADSDFLDHNYAAFGYVVAGLSTVDAICNVDLTYNEAGERSVPITPVVITSAVFVTPK